MKKFSKWLSAIVLAFLFLSSTLSVGAQADWGTVLQNINEASQTVQSMSGTGDLSFNVTAEGEEQASGQFALDFRYNVDPRFSGDVSLDGTTSFAVPEYDDEWNVVATNMEEEAVQVSATILEGIVYAFDGSTWTVEELGETEYEVSEEIHTAVNEAAANQTEVTEDMVAFYEKYFDLSETDTDYVFALKPDINTDELWADLQEVSGEDLESIKQTAIDESIASMEESTGQPVPEEERAMFEQMYDQSFDLGLSLLQNLTISYNKDNYMISAISFDLDISAEDIAGLYGEDVNAEDLGQFQITAVLNLTFADHGQTFDIQVPADAPTFTESTEESSAVSEEITDPEPEESSETTTEETTETESAPESSSDESGANGPAGADLFNPSDDSEE